MQAQALGLAGLALTDRNSLAGIVRAHQQAKESGLRFLVGCRLDLVGGTSLLCWPTDRPAYARLSSLLTHGKRLAAKGGCTLTLDDVLGARRGADLRPAPARDAGRRFRRAGRPAAAGVAATALSRPEPSLRRRRCPATREPGRARARGRDQAARHQRRPLPPSRPAAFAGRADLHPRACAAPGRGPAPVRQCRAPPEAASRDGAAVPGPSRRAREHAGDRRALPVLARPSWPTTTRSRAATTAARRTRSWPAARWRARGSATRTICRRRSSSCSGTSWS